MSSFTKQLRICLYGGPGCGKSTLAAFVFGKLKQYGCSVELVNEYIKQWAYEGKPIKGFDQLYVFAKQLRLEERVLRAGVEVIVTDSPLFLQSYYSTKNNSVEAVEITQLAKKFDQIYPSLNLFLKRHDGGYQQQGRYQTYEEALLVDSEMRAFLDTFGLNIIDVGCDPQEVLVLALHKLKGII